MAVLAPPKLPSRPSIRAPCAIRFSAAASAKRLQTAQRTLVKLWASTQRITEVNPCLAGSGVQKRHVT